MKARDELSSLENVTKCVEEFHESQTQEDTPVRICGKGVQNYSTL
jgi:hypothetical protein